MQLMIVFDDRREPIPRRLWNKHIESAAESLHTTPQRVWQWLSAGQTVSTPTATYAAADD